jgi:hypothetical protein
MEWREKTAVESDRLQVIGVNRLLAGFPTDIPVDYLHPWQIHKKAGWIHNFS